MTKWLWVRLMHGQVTKHMDILDGKPSWITKWPVDVIDTDQLVIQYSPHGDEWQFFVKEDLLDDPQ